MEDVGGGGEPKQAYMAGASGGGDLRGGREPEDPKERAPVVMTMPCGWPPKARVRSDVEGAVADGGVVNPLKMLSEWVSVGMRLVSSAICARSRGSEVPSGLGAREGEC
jgi:hypothetical protein